VKQFSLFILLLTISFFSYSQTKADSISVVFPKILIVNGKQEVLLVFDSSRKAYEVPSIGFLQGPVSFKSYIDTAVKQAGISYSSFRLGGIFTYVYPDRYRTYIRPYFVVRFQGYTNSQGLLDASWKWFPVKEALKEIKYPASVKIVRQIMEKPKQVWSATFEEYGYTNPVDVSKIKFRVIEDFTKMN
jgi:hypothetical protein